MGLGGAFSLAQAKVAAAEEAKNLAELQEKQQLTDISDGNVEILAVDGMKRDFSRAVSGQLYNIGVENSTTNVDYSNPGMSYNGGSSALGGDISGVSQSGATLNFESSVAFMFQLEGGFTIGKNGNNANKGILQNEYNDWRVKNGKTRQSIRAITTEEARIIYKEQYWDLMKCGSILPPLNFVVFDTAVLSGEGRARDLLKMVKEKYGTPTQENVIIISYWWIDYRDNWLFHLGDTNEDQRKQRDGYRNRMANVKEFITKNSGTKTIVPIRRDSSAPTPTTRLPGTPDALWPDKKI